jgi:hypothetical protein
MTERSTDQTPMTYSELRHHASQLEKENERLKAYKRNARKALRQLNAKMLVMVAGARLKASGHEHTVSFDEQQADLVKTRKRAQQAESVSEKRGAHIAELVERVAQLHAEQEGALVIPPGLAELEQDERDTFVSEFNASGNGKAAAQ